MEQVKTVLLGMLIAVVLMMLMGAGSTGGRYQIAGADGNVYYILDTDTGKIVAAGGYAPTPRLEDDQTRGSAAAAVSDEKRY